ncbi:MAG: polysaccharide deacetylase family protein [Chloroflexi bacterium]|nr:polysaccharide deacetylase family protein [Chloroflexota bacterium]
MMSKFLTLALRAAFVVGLASLAVGSADSPVVQIAALLNSPTPTPTNTFTPTRVPTFTATPTNTFTSTPTLTLTLTAIPTRTRTPTPTPTINPNLRVARVPVLMYHSISIPPPDADAVRLDLSVLPQAFDEQMAFLIYNGYRTIRAADLAESLLFGAPLPEKAIVLTFDDGYADAYETAFPILKKYGMTATFYVITQFVETKKSGYLTWQQLQEMANAGMEIGSHSVDHPDLRGKTIAYQNTQLAGSKQMIEARLPGVTVKTFCYPSGRYDLTTIAVLRLSGYLSAFTEIQGVRQTNEDIFEMRRVRVRGSYTLTDYAYWLNWFTTSGR